MHKLTKKKDFHRRNIVDIKQLQLKSVTEQQAEKVRPARANSKHEAFNDDGKLPTGRLL